MPRPQPHYARPRSSALSPTLLRRLRRPPLVQPEPAPRLRVHRPSDRSRQPRRRPSRRRVLEQRLAVQLQQPVCAADSSLPASERIPDQRRTRRRQRTDQQRPVRDDRVSDRTPSPHAIRRLQGGAGTKATFSALHHYITAAAVAAADSDWPARQGSYFRICMRMPPLGPTVPGRWTKPTGPVSRHSKRYCLSSANKTSFIS